MRFIILTKFGQKQIEAEDFDDAVNQAYEDHVGYEHVMAIIKVENE